MPPSAAPGVGGEQKNYEKIVHSYLKQKGYLRTEQVFREELQSRFNAERLLQEGLAEHNYYPVTTHVPSEHPPQAYTASFAALSEWVHGSLDLYKAASDYT